MENIKQINENYRMRMVGGEWKIEKKHLYTGVWVLTTEQFLEDMEWSIADLFEEMETDRVESENLYKDPEELSKFLKEELDAYKDIYVEEYGYTGDISVSNVLHVSIGSGLMNSSMEIIFDGDIGEGYKRYLVETWYCAGTWIEPADEGFELTELVSVVSELREHIERFTTVDMVKARNRNLNTEEEIANEVKRLRNILSSDINRMNFLEKYLV